MAKETPDPSATFLDWVTQWERSFDSMANQLMGTEGFSQAMNEFQKSQLNAQRMFAQNMAQLLTNMNMPTREDILRLSEAVQGIDRRLERIEEQITGTSARAPSTAKKPPRTKQPEAATKAAAAPETPTPKQPASRETTPEEAPREQTAQGSKENE